MFPHAHGQALASDPALLQRHFGVGDLIPLWIAEPYVDLAPPVVRALKERASRGWYGYEVRPEGLAEAFWSWMAKRHRWDGSGLTISVSPSVGTSLALLIEEFTVPEEGVILQPPVFTDFKPLITRLGRKVVRNSLVLEEGGYRMDLEDLAEKASRPDAKMMILCNPHNPVGRVWSNEELRSVAEICAVNDVVVVADEIHSDIILPPHAFVPFATVTGDIDLTWAATHGPIKTFGLAGVCDTLLVTDVAEVSDAFRKRSSQLHMARNNVFALAALEAAYREGGPWLDGFLDLIVANLSLVRDGLPEGIKLVEPEGTYLAWLDFRQLGIEVPELGAWLARKVGIALSPGHWFGREGAGFARMTVATPRQWTEEAVGSLRSAMDAEA